MSSAWPAPHMKLPTFHKADERILKEGSKSLLFRCSALHAVQIRAGSLDLARHTSYESGDCRPRLDHRRNRAAFKLMHYPTLAIGRQPA
jgi:hypothetical protein